jgi:magnesium transporter
MVMARDADHVALRNGERAWCERTLSDGSVWIDLREASEPALAKLEARFGFHRLALEDAASELQRPKVDRYDDYLFVVLHFPQEFSGSALRAWELNAFVADSALVTYASGHEPVMSTTTTSEADGSLDAVEAQLYRILSSGLDQCEPLLDEIAGDLGRFDRETACSELIDAATVSGLSQTKQRVISYRRVIGPDRTALDQLLRADGTLVSDAYRPYLADVADRIERVWDQLAGFKEVAEGLEATNESRLAHRQNDVLQRLTAISVIGLPIAIASGMLGMNVGGVPMHHDGHGFWLMFAVMLALGAVVAALFKRLNWF